MQNDKRNDGVLTFDALSKRLQSEWRFDRSARQRIPLDQAHRNCLGLACIFDKAPTKTHISRLLVANEDVRWLAIRDVPVGHFPLAGAAMDGREVNYASVTNATLKYGMPVLDFHTADRRSWDFRFMPFGTTTVVTQSSAALVTAGGDILNVDEHGEEFAALNRVSARMTKFAHTAVRPDGKPYRPAWARESRYQPARPIRPQVWMPKAYLAFPRLSADRVFEASTTVNANDDAKAIKCPDCGKQLMLKSLQAGALEFFENGDFTGKCHYCGKQQKWFLDHVVDVYKPVRRLTKAFREGFVAAVETGLKMAATENVRYLGDVKHDSPSHDGLVKHIFLSTDTHRRFAYFFPPDARLHLEAQDENKDACDARAGYSIGKLLPTPPKEWRDKSFEEKWASLATVCGGVDQLHCLQKLWFDNQSIRVKGHDDIVLYPVSLVSYATATMRPVGLWWDFGNSADYIGSSNHVAFPPVPLENWDRLQLSLCGEVRVDARIGDPRFRPERRTAVSRDRRPQQPRGRLQPSHSARPVIAKPAMTPAQKPYRQPVQAR